MKTIYISILIMLTAIPLVHATCGDGFCDLSKENYDLCSEDCIKEENYPNNNMDPQSKDRDFANIEESRVLPKNLQRQYNNLFFIIPFLIIIIFLPALFFLNTTIAGKNLKEYLWPIRFYVLGAILIVISQYVIGLNYDIPYFLNLTQALLALMIVFSLIKLIKTYRNFSMLNVVILGILYSTIIHGLKVSIRFFFYFKPVWYLLDRFLYGSLLVMIIVLITGPTAIYLKKKGVKI